MNDNRRFGVITEQGFPVYGDNCSFNEVAEVDEADSTKEDCEKEKQ